MLTVSYNKDLLLLILFLEIAILGIVQVCGGIFLAGKEKEKVYGITDVLAGAINLGIVIVVLLF